MIKPIPTLVVCIILTGADVLLGIAFRWPTWTLIAGAALLGLGLASLSMLIGRSQFARRHLQRPGRNGTATNYSSAANDADRMRMLSVSETRTAMGFPRRDAAARSLADMVRSATTKAQDRES